MKRKSFERGPSVESEFTFTKAVTGYSKLAIEAGSFKGRQIGNVKEQLAARARLEEKDRGQNSENFFIEFFHLQFTGIITINAHTN